MRKTLTVFTAKKHLNMVTQTYVDFLYVGEQVMVYSNRMQHRMVDVI